MSYKVYKITSPTGRVYIGVTTNLEARFQKGRGYKTNPMFDDIIKYGWDNFVKEVIFETNDKLEAQRVEHQEIKRYPDGYNIYRTDVKFKEQLGYDRFCKPVKCVETGCIYKSIKEAARQTGLSKNKISYCCRGIRNTTGGYHFEFAPIVAI